jgi:hypothetical protein
MSHRIVVDVIHGRPEVRVATHQTVRSRVPYATAASILLFIPVKGSPSMKLAERPNNAAQITRTHEQVIMIWKHAPSMNSSRYLRDGGQQCAGEALHAFPRMTDVRCVMQTCGCEVICAVAANRMWWAVPREGGSVLGHYREGSLLAPREQSCLLFSGELSPEIATKRAKQNVE